jgi:cytochrome c oxidase cbb3-type subunit 3
MATNRDKFIGGSLLFSGLGMLPVVCSFILMAVSVLASPVPLQDPSDAPGSRQGSPGADDQDDKHPKMSLALPPDPDPAVVERGKKLFVASCAFCHGANATGGASGPNLVRSVTVLHDKGTGLEIAGVLLDGRTDKGMPKFPFTQEQIKDIAGFLLSRQNAAGDRRTYHVEFKMTGDAASGRKFFAAQCASCHAHAESFKSVVQANDPAHLQDLFLMPQGHRKQATVTTSSGESDSGELVQLDDFAVTIREKSGLMRSWTLGPAQTPRVKVIDPLQGHRDLLPKYTDRDIHDVLAYLETLK